MSFCTLNDLKLVLKIDTADTSQDDLLNSIVDASNSEMLSLFNLESTVPTSYANTYDVTDAFSRGMWLYQYPVISITSVSIDGTVIDPSKYYLKHPKGFGLIAGIDDNFYQSTQKIEITHVAGFDPVPASLTRAAVVLAANMYNTEAKTGFKSERIGQYSYTLGGEGNLASDFPAQTKRALSQWLRPFAESY